MGRDKASLPFGGETLLARVVRRLGDVLPIANVVVVAGWRQEVPPLAPGAVVVHESQEGAGPLVALVEGLERLAAGAESAFVCGCDAPFLQAALVERLFELLVRDAVVPRDAERMYPLAAVYRRKCLPRLRAAAAAGERSLHRALEADALAVDAVDIEDLRAVDPELASLVNCNTPGDYEGALRRASS
jgi:molybdopterin-guanine dinucleotide biosynthesis protein A